MQKIISLYQRNYEGDKLVRDEVVPGAEWVLAGEGVATRKYDGTCCAVIGGVFYKRLEWNHNKGDAPPQWLHWDFKPEQRSGHGWFPVGDGPDDWMHRAAWARGVDDRDQPFVDGTYEMCGPRLQKNVEGFEVHTLVPHGRDVLADFPRTFEEIKAYLEPLAIEGVVWHHPDGRMVKIKRRDFFKMGPKRRHRRGSQEGVKMSDQIIGELHPMTCGACGSVLADVSKPCGACGWIVETITDRVARLQKEVEELAEWKAEEQRFLVTAASKLLVAGYKGEGVLDGIMWLIEKAKVYDDFIAAILALEPHRTTIVPHVEALLDKVKESRKLREAISDAGFSVMQTSDKWSIHDVSEKGKAEDARTLEVVNENLSLEVENRRLRALIDVAKLRCQYILGVCRGEEEMKAEARSILDAMEKADG